MKISNKISLIAMGISLSFYSSPSQAVEKGLLDILLKNGTISNTQYNQLLKEQTITETNNNSDVKIKLNKKGLQIETIDKQFKLKIGARMHADITSHSGDGELIKQGSAGTEIRRARIYIKGTVWKNFDYITELDFADNKTAIKDLFMTYSGLTGKEITFGHQKQAISMEVQESSNDIMFSERSLVYSLTAPLFDRALGLNFKAFSSNWSAQIGIYGDSVPANKDNSNDEGWALTTRLTYAPVNSKSQVLHLGTYAGFRTSNDNGSLLNSASGNQLELSYETTHMSNLKLTEAKISNVKNALILGFEAAYMNGPFSLQGEYARLKVNRYANTTALGFDAFYIQTGWTLTGESRSYKGSDGEFKRLKPANDFSLGNKGWGAFEIAARLGGNDLDSHDIQGGSEKGLTFAFNWYLNENVRIITDYRRAFDIVNSTITRLDGSEINSVETFTLRTQWAF